MGGRPISREILDPLAFLLDLDGTLYTTEGPIPGAVEALASLRRRAVPVRFITNTTRRSRREVLLQLREFGFAVEDDELFTPSRAATSILQRRGVETAAPFVAPEGLSDSGSFRWVGGTVSDETDASPDAVVVGDLGEAWTPALLNEALRYLMAGATLIALQKGRYWLGPSGFELDAGAYVSALEFAAGIDGIVCGKPEAPFYEAAVSTLGPAILPEQVVVIGDDVWNDVRGAQDAGLQGWLVKTGKFQQKILEDSGVSPDRVIASVAEMVV